MLMRRAIVAAVCCVVSCSCAPWTGHYQHIEVPEARYFQTVCWAGFGPPSRAYYPYHGIFISLDITDLLNLGLHLPAGSTVLLNGKTVHITGLSDSGPDDVIIPIRAAKHGSLGSIDPREFRDTRDPFTTPNNFGPLTGETENGSYIWYMFIGELPIPPTLIRGIVELPPMTINGEHYEPQVLHFEQRSYSGIEPVNC
jgi:hypothetical protein